MGRASGVIERELVRREDADAREQTREFVRNEVRATTPPVSARWD
jgi:hypothetical protein